MSRARNIKPGFFKNDQLAECHPLARILFAGLWCEADREGRLEDRPKRLKVECLPYDDCDVDALLSDLAKRGFIQRYEVNGVAYIAIAEFLKHQNPHQRESASVIPGPVNEKASQGGAKAQPRQCSGDDEHGTGPADSSSPFPDSPSQGEIDAQATLAGECGKAMRDAGCFTLNQSDPDFLAALKEGVTPKEFSDAVAAAKGRNISGAGLFGYAVGIARTNHAKVAAQVIVPAARAGPAQSHGKTMGAIMALEGMKDGLDEARTADRISEAAYARIGASASG